MLMHIQLNVQESRLSKKNHLPLLFVLAGLVFIEFLHELTHGIGLSLDH